MSALARYFHHLGMNASGYDKTRTALTEQLSSEGIHVFYEDRVQLLPAPFHQLNKEQNLVIFTPAVPSELQLFKFLRGLGYVCYKRSAVLGLISKSRYTIAVAGTHGKTTTSTMIAHILQESGIGCSAFLGGIATNYGTNTLFSDNQYVVVEADEFDRSFLALQPNIAVVTATDPDHLDIYGDANHVLESFNLFINQVVTGGVKIIRKGLPLAGDITYAAGEEATCYADDIHIKEASFYFTYRHPDGKIGPIKLGISGRHNIENAVGAIAACRTLGIADAEIIQALECFKGVKRRFEYVVNNAEHIYIDDYAHHPAELKACIQAVRALYPQHDLTFIFQPHLYSRTRDFVDEFAEALSLVDELILMDIYPAREEPIPGISSLWLLGKIKLENKTIKTEDEIFSYIERSKPKLLVTAGAGNVDLLVQPLKEILTHV